MGNEGRIEIRDESGSVMVLGIAVVVGFVSLLMVVASASSWLLARSHAASVADIAALAAAARGSCDAAHEVARNNQSRLSECTWQGSDVVVIVSTEVRRTPVVLPEMSVEVSARAGF